MTIAAEKATQLTAAYNYSPVVALVTGDLSTYIATADSGTDMITATGHNFVDGVPVTFTNTGGALFGGIVLGQTYYVINTATNTFKVSETVGGTAVNITSNGSGANTVTEVAIAEVETNYTDASVVWDVMVRHEVASYQGSSRQSFSFGSLSQDLKTGEITLASAKPAIIPITRVITCEYAVLLRGANTTRGDGTGSVASIQDLGSLTIGLQGHNFDFSAVFP